MKPPIFPKRRLGMCQNRGTQRQVHLLHSQGSEKVITVYFQVQTGQVRIRDQPFQVGRTCVSFGIPFKRPPPHAPPAPPKRAPGVNQLNSRAVLGAAGGGEPSDRQEDPLQEVRTSSLTCACEQTSASFETKEAPRPSVVVDSGMWPCCCFDILVCLIRSF